MKKEDLDKMKYNANHRREVEGVVYGNLEGVIDFHLLENVILPSRNKNSLKHELLVKDRELNTLKEEISLLKDANKKFLDLNKKLIERVEELERKVKLYGF